jgi:hypothetical protein
MMANWTWTDIARGTVTDEEPINSMGRQVQALVNPQRSSVAVTTGPAGVGTTETEIMRINGFVFKDGRAYRCVITGGASSAGGNEAGYSIYKTSAVGGNRLTEFYRFPMSTLVRNTDGTRYLKNVTGADVTLNVLLTMFASSGTANAFATVETPFSFQIEDCGNAADYSYANGVS